ncbi:MAG TPA: hypothetical protein VH573_06880 [Mycobacteriales bacterium]|jgi:hypothetical protein
MRPADEVLRDVFAEQAAGITPDGDVYGAVLARRRRNRRRAVVGAGVAAAIVVGGAAAAVPAVRGADRSVPAVTPSPTENPLTACVPPVLPGEKPPPAPVPVSQLPRQHDVRGSLARNRAVTDAALVAGWQGILLDEAGLASLGAQHDRAAKRTMDPASLRLRFVERAGAGTVALVTAADRTGRWQQASWVVGQGSTFRATGGPGELATSGDLELAQRFYGDDPLFVSAYPVCGKIFGVVLAPRDATATLHESAHIDSDARRVTGATRTLRLTDGLGIFPTSGGASKVSVSRGGTVLGTGSLNQFDGLATAGPDPLDALVDKAVKDAPPGTDARLVGSIVELARHELRDYTADPVVGVRVRWAGLTNKAMPTTVVALTLPSGASYLSDMSEEPDGSSGGSGAGFVPAGQLDRFLYAYGDRSRLIVVVPKGATRAEVRLAGGRVQQVPLRYGGAFVVPAAKPLKVRAFDKDGNLVDEQVPNEGLLRP